MRHSARLEARGIPNLSAVELEKAHTPEPLISPPESNTPPSEPIKLPRLDEAQDRNNDEDARTQRFNQNLDVEDDKVKLQHERETTPGESPRRKRPRIYNDRLIPSRSGQDLRASYNLMFDDGSPATPSRSQKKQPQSELQVQKLEEANRTFSTLLRSELFDSAVPQSIAQAARPGSPTNVGSYGKSPSTPSKNMFNYSSPAQITPRSISRSDRGPNVNPRSDIYSLSPVRYSSQKLLLSPRKAPRAVSKVPYKVLDAPELADDFYLNLVDWGNSNVLAVGLGDSVYLWNSETGKVDLLVKLEDEHVTSVGWIQKGCHLAIGTSKGFITVWDTEKRRRLRVMTGHSSRVSSMAWNQHILSTGSRDRSILHRDVRSPDQYFRRLVGHRQEVCGLRWNHDTNQIASGGNDNKVFVWNGVDDKWQYRWGESDGQGGHRAAVKAVAWSPHQRGLLATGGGTADRCIKFWNTIGTNQTANTPFLNGLDSVDMHNFDAPVTRLSEVESPTTPTNPNLIKSHDTGSQVCNLIFSTLTSELVSTHGYSQHAINVWKYPSMSQVVSLTGHTYRVLYLSMNPTGDTIVTGAGDETLRFWDVFGSKMKEKKESARSSLIKEWGTIR